MYTEDAIQRRRSVRDYAGQPMTLEELSRLLYYADGINAERWGHKLRAAPSAGALYPIEIYPVVHRVEELQPGLYHYLVRDHALELLQAGDLRGEIVRHGLMQEFLGQANLVLVFTAIFQRLRWKYQERTYRYALLEAGHLGQNVYLAATSMGMGACAVGAFLDDDLNAMLGVDGVSTRPPSTCSLWARCDGLCHRPLRKAQTTREFMTTAPVILAWILMLVGLAGTLLPVLPGTALIWLGAALYAWTTDFARVGGWLLLGLAAIAAAAYGLGYLTSAVGARGTGASRWGMGGAVAGGLAGLLLLGPAGILVGPFVGAVVGEMVAGRRDPEAIQAGVGGVLGALGGAAQLPGRAVHDRPGAVSGLVIGRAGTSSARRISIICEEK